MLGRWGGGREEVVYLGEGEPGEGGELVGSQAGRGEPGQDVTEHATFAADGVEGLGQTARWPRVASSSVTACTAWVGLSSSTASSRSRTSPREVGSPVGPVRAGVGDPAPYGYCLDCR